MSDAVKPITAVAVVAGDQIEIHIIDPIEQRADILDYQVEDCPTCQSKLEDGFEIGEGGFGPYGFCPKCERFIRKCQVEM